MAFQGKKILSAGEAYLDKQERISKMFNDKDLNIRISWAVNCAVEMTRSAVEELLKNPDDGDKIKVAAQTSLNQWTDYFLDLFHQKRNAIVNKNARKMEIEEQSLEGQVRDSVDEPAGEGIVVKND